MAGTEQATAQVDATVFAQLSGEARQLFRQDMTAQRYLEALSKAALFPDALKCLGYVLGAAQSVSWAAVCMKELSGADEHGAERDAARKAVNEWLAARTEEKRRAAKDAADAAGVNTPEGCLAMAAFLAEGSMAPAHVQSVPAPPHAAEKLAASAVLLSVVNQPRQMPERFERCLALGLKDVKA